jgi:hypothetical protein
LKNNTIKETSFLIVLLTFVFLVPKLKAQDLPEFAPVFPQDEITTIKIVMDPDSLALIVDNLDLYSDHEYPATFIFQNSSLVDTVENIGFRLRGNTSREAAKKSFKISFNTFSNNQWQGLEKLNLNGQHNDPSLIRTKLCWDMIREAGLPGARTSYVKLYVNDEFKGVYLNVEHYDENFAATYFDNQGDGNLFKCLYPADLDYVGSNPDLYKMTPFGTRTYDLKTNLYEDDYTDLADFISMLNNSSSNQLLCNLQEKFNVDDYLKYAALEVLQGHWDGYIFNNNNYYLYHDQKTDRINWIAYDLDNTLGIDWFDMSWANRNIYNWDQSGTDRPLYELLIDNVQLKNQFSQYISQYLDMFFEPSWAEDKATFYQNMLIEAVEEDLYYNLDYGFTPNDFLNAYDEAWGNHVPTSIHDYIATRKFNAELQLDNITPFVEVHDIWDNSPAQSNILIGAEIIGNPASVNVKYTVDGVNYITVPMNGDFNSYVASITNPNQEKITYQIEVVFNNSTQLYPCTPRTIWTSITSGEIILNEVLSNNISGVSDEAGEYVDWIEVFNMNASALNLKGYYLTDDYGNWNKWRLPATVAEPSTHHVLLCDNDEEDGAYHTNFSLNASGEVIYLMKIQNNAFRMVDAVEVPSLTSDVSFGREIDASTSWIFFSEPTPYAPNGTVGIGEFESQTFTFYPNPASNNIRFSKNIDSLSLTDAQGRKVGQWTNITNLDVSSLSNGLYLLQMNTETFRLVISR